jgi:hypothetical protein
MQLEGRRHGGQYYESVRCDDPRREPSIACVAVWGFALRRAAVVGIGVFGSLRSIHSQDPILTSRGHVAVDICVGFDPAVG